MKTFWKIFIVSFVFFFIAIFFGSYSYIKFNDNRLKTDIGGGESRNKDKIQMETDNKIESYSSLAEAYKNSKRVNFIMLGMDDFRTDTIIFTSFDSQSKEVNAVSIPRDTYIHRKGHDRGEERKINAIYKDHGIEGVKKAISHIMKGAPIHHYVMLDYKGVENIIDSLGGVEVLVPFHMKYSDITASPPLNIDIKEGKQVLNGRESLNFLRYRQGNNKKGGYIDGDLGRIKAQQDFLKSFVDKALSYRLALVVKKGFEHVKTDIKLLQGITYSRRALGIKSDDFSFLTLPGSPELKRYDGKVFSYYIFNPEKTNQILEEIYNIEKAPEGK